MEGHLGGTLWWRERLERGLGAPCSSSRLLDCHGVLCYHVGVSIIVALAAAVLMKHAQINELLVNPIFRWSPS